jgi:anti-sigma regulatory factor (Ser/Thr protein kinase)
MSIGDQRMSSRKGGFVGFGVMQAESDSVSLRVPFTAPSAARVRRELRDWMVAQGLPSDLVEDARIVVSELVGNSVRHAHPLPVNDIVVRWWLEGDALALSVSDGGGGRSSPHAVAASMSAVSGRGLSIVDALAERWWVEDRDGRTTVHVHMAV